ncbi:MAG: carboxypeptidase regulatory-like domain-containing protein [Acidobacteriota bacterium]
MKGEGIFRRALVSVPVICSTFWFAQAQVTFGEITGTVSDDTGAVVPGVSVTVSNQATNVSRTVISGDRGNYRGTHLVPGSYSVSAELSGFKRFVHEDIDVGALETVRIDIQLEVGELATEVTVESGAPVVNSENPTIAQSRTFRELRDLPTNIHGPAPLYKLTWLTPTAVQGGGSRRTFGGGRASTTHFYVDGASSNSPAFANQLGPLNPSFESLQEVRFEYVNARAEFSELGNVTAVTKSGGNEFHGTLFWNNIHSALSARPFFARTRGPIDPQTGEELFTQNNQVGGSLGGPIVRDKAFFFFSYDYDRDSRPDVITPNLPTLKMREGDFSELDIDIINPFTGEAFPNNNIPAEMLHPSSLAWQERFFPEPNFGPPDSFTDNFRGSFASLDELHQFVNRLDFNVFEKHGLYWRLMYNVRLPGNLEGGLPPDIIGFRRQRSTGAQMAVSDTWTLSPALINEFILSYGRRHADRRNLPVDPNQLIDMLGIQGLPEPPSDDFAPPDVRISGFHRVGIAGPTNYIEEIAQISDNLTWIKGRHTYKMGIAFVPQRYTSYRFGDGGRYDFKKTFTGFSYADFLLGLPQTTFVETERDTVYIRYYHLNWFFQDDFNLTPRLTLNYGIRWDYNSPQVDKFDVFSSFDPATGSVVVPSEASLAKVDPSFPEEIPILTADEAGFPGRGLRAGDKNNFAPRLGFAFRPFSNARSVVRGGYGIYYDDFTSGITANQIFSGPFTVERRFRNSIEGGEAVLTFDDPFLGQETMGAIQFRFTAPDVVNPYIQQWNLTLEQDIGFNTGLRLSYIGSKGTQLTFRRNTNQPPPSTEPFSNDRRPLPFFGELRMTDNGGNSSYNALSVNLERKMRGGLYFQTNWTWAKSLADVDDDGNVERGIIIENAFCRACERGNTRYSPRHRLIANLIWELPFGAGRRFSMGQGFLDHLLGGWKISSTFIGQTGQFLTPEFSGSDPSNTDTFGGRPDRIGDGNLPSDQRSIDGWFDAGAFVVPPNGRFGNAGAGIIVGPGRAVFDFGLFKRFQIGDESWLRVQATATNAWGNPSFDVPEMNISNPGSRATIDSIYSRSDFAGPREIMLGLRFEF